MCQSCEVMNINGINCHEIGCPDSYKDELRICKWCGSEFKPDEMCQPFCDDECESIYFN